MMKLFGLVLSVLLLGVQPMYGGPATPAPEKDNFMFTQEATDATGCVLLYLNITRSSATSGLSRLTYELLDYCVPNPPYGWPTVVAFGFGDVPDAAFTITSNITQPKASGLLDVTVPTDDPNFYIEGLTGRITMAFVRSGLFFRTSVGTQRYEDPEITVISRGTFASTSATLSGTAFGYSFESTNGIIGNSKQASVEVLKKH